MSSISSFTEYQPSESYSETIVKQQASPRASQTPTIVETYRRGPQENQSQSERNLDVYAPVPAYNRNGVPIPAYKFYPQPENMQNLHSAEYRSEPPLLLTPETIQPQEASRAYDRQGVLIPTETSYQELEDVLNSHSQEYGPDPSPQSTPETTQQQNRIKVEGYADIYSHYWQDRPDSNPYSPRYEPELSQAQPIPDTVQHYPAKGTRDDAEYGRYPYNTALSATSSDSNSQDGDLQRGWHQPTYRPTDHYLHQYSTHFTPTSEESRALRETAPSPQSEPKAQAQAPPQSQPSSPTPPGPVDTYPILYNGATSLQILHTALHHSPTLSTCVTNVEKYIDHLARQNNTLHEREQRRIARQVRRKDVRTAVREMVLARIGKLPLNTIPSSRFGRGLLPFVAERRFSRREAKMLGRMLKGAMGGRDVVVMMGAGEFERWCGGLEEAKYSKVWGDVSVRLGRGKLRVEGCFGAKMRG